MKFMYFFDDKIKRHIMKGKKYCNPAETGNYECGISCIRQGDVNLWFYTKNGVTIAVDSGHLNYRGVENSFQQIGINPEEIKHVFITHADVDHCGGIDTSGTNIYPNAQVYLGKAESAYLNGSIHRMAGILADAYQFSSEDLRRRRAESVQNVRKTNGRISLEQRVRGAWEEDDEWQD